ncbi:17223_t:CDS:2, partial [Racocetra fulgida]
KWKLEKENEVKKYKEGYENLVAQIKKGEVNAIENALKNVLGIKDIKEKLAARDKEVEKMQQQKADLETKLTEKNAEITDLTEKITAKEAEFTQKSEELNEIRAAKNDVEKTYNETKREKTAAEKEHEAVKDELTREQDAHKDTQNALAAEKNAHALTAATKNKTEKELNDDLEKMSEQLSKEQKKTQSLQTKCHELRQEKSTLQDNFNQQERENEILIRLNTDLHHQLEAALKNYQQTKNELQTKQTANQQLSQDVEKLQADERDKEIRKTNLLKKATQSLRNKLSQQTNNLTGLLSVANNTIRTYEKYLKEELKISDLNNLPSVPAPLATLINFFNNPPNCLNPQHSDYDSLKNRLRQAETECDQLATENQKLKNQNNLTRNDNLKDKSASQPTENKSSADSQLVNELRNQITALNRKISQSGATNEKELLNRISSDLSLDLSPPINYDRVITAIQQLIKNKSAESHNQELAGYGSLTNLLAETDCQKVIIASPSKYSSEHSALSIFINYLTKTKIIGKIPARAFTPAPSVDGVLVSIEPYQDVDVSKEQLISFLRFLKNCFRFRRKTLLNNLLSSLVVALGGGIFWLGKKMGAKNKASQTKVDQQRVKLEKELQKLNEQLQNENDPAKKQELEQKTKAIEQQIQNLGHNSPNPPINPGGNGQQPPINNNETHRQITVKYNTEVGGKHEYIDINDNKKRVLIDTKNKIFSSASNLTIKDNQYNFSFYEEDATEKRGNGFIFDENNDTFQLIPITTAPSPSKNPKSTPPPSSQTPPPSQSKKKIVLKMKYMFNSGFDHYVFGGEGRNGRTVFISQKNPSVNKILKKNFAEYEISFELDPVEENYFETTKIMFFEENDSVEVVELAELIINNCPEIELVNCAANSLTDVGFLTTLDPEKLTNLYLEDNNISEQDLSCFAKFVNLTTLLVGNSDKNKIKQGIYNRFTGNLECLKNLSKLERLSIKNTDIDRGLEFLPRSVQEFHCSADQRKESGVKKIAEELQPFLISSFHGTYDFKS